MTHATAKNEALPSTSRRLFARMRKYRAVIVACAISVIGVALVVSYVSEVLHKCYTQAAIAQAESVSNALREFRTVYTSEVVERVRQHGITISHDYQQSDASIPLPATLTHILGERLSAHGSNREVRLYSEFPFPWRVDGGPLTEFERDALRQLERDPTQPVIWRDDSQERPMLHYATADVMRASCIACHNSHPDTPKNDWKEGDLRGVLAVTIDLDTAAAASTSSVRGLAALLLVMVLLGGGGIVIFVISTVRHARAQERANLKLERQNKESEAAEAALLLSGEKYRIVSDFSSDCIYWRLPGGDLSYISPACYGVTGYTAEEFMASSELLDTIVHPDDCDLWAAHSQRASCDGSLESLEFRIITKDGRTRWISHQCRPVHDDSGEFQGICGSNRDITERKEMEGQLRDHSSILIGALEREKRATSDQESAMSQLKAAMSELQFAATTDRLTGLPNRKILMERLKQAMKRSNRDGSRFAILFFDFDRFKVVNDSLGHDVGDALLCDIADIFRREVRESDTVARFGGDEFVVLLDCLPEWSDAVKMAKRLLHVLAEPHDISGHRIVSTASIGLVTNEHAHQNSTDIIRDADVAMYQAKADGRGRVVNFDSAMHEHAMSRLSLEADLRFAIEEDQLRLVYQPIVDLETGAVSGFESLIRWDHPERGVISPIDFIPIAEETGLIIDIGQWVLRTACRQIADWNHRLGLEANLSMNVNISKRQLLGSSLVDDVLKCLREFDVPAEDLKLEITESAIADERSDVAPLLTQLREHGLHIAMDDFGTGVSSLSALHEYPIDVLKIDQSFVRNLDGDRSLLAVVDSVTTLAENLGITTVAEGIETAETLAALQSIGCTWGQGYYFAEPMTPADAEAYLLDIRKEKCVA